MSPQRQPKMTRGDITLHIIIITLVVVMGVNGHIERRQIKTSMSELRSNAELQALQMIETLAKVTEKKQELEQEKVERIKPPPPKPTPTPKVIVKRITVKPRKARSKDPPWYKFFKQTR